jgi:hypothetical protein
MQNYLKVSLKSKQKLKYSWGGYPNPNGRGHTIKSVELEGAQA